MASKKIPEQEYLAKRYKKLGGWNYRNGLYYDEEKQRYIKYYRGKHSKILKKMASRYRRLGKEFDLKRQLY